MNKIKTINPFPEIRPCGLGIPSFGNTADACAVGRCRMDGGDLWRVTAIKDETANRLGFDLPPLKASQVARELDFNPGFSDITLIQIRKNGFSVNGAL